MKKNRLREDGLVVQRLTEEAIRTVLTTRGGEASHDNSNDLRQRPRMERERERQRERGGKLKFRDRN